MFLFFEFQFSTHRIIHISFVPGALNIIDFLGWDVMVTAEHNHTKYIKKKSTMVFSRKINGEKGRRNGDRKRN